MGFELAVGSRVMETPYHAATVAAGVTSFTVYNHTLLPMSYGDPAAEYDRLLNGVAIWDVAAQRQIELSGPDAGALAQLLCTRDLSTAKVGQGKYTAMVDHSGRLLNDPLVLCAGEDQWWISIADGDMLHWCRAIAAERGMDVAITDNEVAPLAVQGPLAEEVVAALMGEWVRDIKFFNYHSTEVDGIPLRLGRAGWSKQGGFELYLEDPTRGVDLWNLVLKAGEPFDIGPGAPNSIERVESGLLSYRTDTTDGTDPFEARLGRYVDLDAGGDFIGRDALVQKRERGLQRRLMGAMFDGDAGRLTNPWKVLDSDTLVGSMMVVVRSPRLDASIGIAMVDAPHMEVGTRLTAQGPHGRAAFEVVDLPFV